MYSGRFATALLTTLALALAGCGGVEDASEESLAAGAQDTTQDGAQDTYGTDGRALSQTDQVSYTVTPAVVSRPGLPPVIAVPVMVTVSTTHVNTSGGPCEGDPSPDPIPARPQRHDPHSDGK